MSDKHYDVIVLGASLGALATAALLARRDFNVLVLGQGARPADYQFRDWKLRRRCFTPLCATSPTLHKVLAELAQAQVFRRKLVDLDPMLTILLPDRRFEMAPDLALLQDEMDREYPEVRRLIDDLYSEITRVNAAADSAFDLDLCWPPQGILQSLQARAAIASLPYTRGDEASLFGAFPPNHPYVEIVKESAYCASHLASTVRDLPRFAIARLHGAWTRGPQGMPAGEDAMTAFFTERICAFGGEMRLSERVVGINALGKDTHRLVLDDAGTVLGATFVVSDGTGEALAHLAQGKGITRSAQRHWPVVTEPAGRFTVSLVVNREAVAQPLGAESLVFPRMPGSPPDALLPTIHLQRIDGDVMADEALQSLATTLLVAEIRLSQPCPLALSEAREAVVSMLMQHFPFLDKHLLAVDSTHDGLPVWVYDNGKRRTVDRIEAHGSMRGPEPMVPVLQVDPPGFLGLAGEPFRGPLARSFLTGRSVFPSLGQEGELLAAWSIAKTITGTDKRKARMRRDMWSRIEFG